MSLVNRNIFLQILNNYPEIQALSSSDKQKRLNFIMADVENVRYEGVGIFDDYVETEEDSWLDIEQLADIEFNFSQTAAERLRAKREFYEKKDEGQKEETFAPISSEDRIRAKQIELGITPDEIIEDGKRVKNGYGQSPLHVAISMRDIDSVRRWVKEKKYLNITDHNGNTPLEMAFQEGFDEAVELIEIILLTDEA
jgi:hypothetical protein